jgi:hypothetical protein
MAHWTFGSLATGAAVDEESWIKWESPASWARATGSNSAAKKKLACGAALFLRSTQFFASSTLADRWKEFRENRKQLRCCNWIQLPTSQSPDDPAVKAGRRMAGD